MTGDTKKTPDAVFGDIEKSGRRVTKRPFSVFALFNIKLYPITVLSMENNISGLGSLRSMPSNC